MNAAMGKILWVDLTAGTCIEEKVPEMVYKTYLSGIGLAAYYLYQRIPAGADALGQENVLGFVSGLLTGTGSFLTGRWMAAAKSPLTGTWGDANCGGTLAPAIKQCGYDGIFFTGISAKPVYLYVNHSKAQLLDASDLWGLDTRETEHKIQGQFDEGKLVSVACIGPTGERLSKIAGIANDQGRMAARSGLGAVMGSKRLKAVVLCGSFPIPVHDPGEMKRLSDRFNRKWIKFQLPWLDGKGMDLLGKTLGVSPLAMRQDGLLYKTMLAKWGTTAMNQTSIEMGDAPIKNWVGSNEDFPTGHSNSSNPDLIHSRELHKYQCYSCPLACGGITSMPDGRSEMHKPEYESVLALGGLLMNTDLNSLFEMIDLLNRAGMDTISAGGTIAFAIECFENGLLTREDTDGLELHWGDSKAILLLVKKMIAREGIGDLLADGSQIAAQKIGRNSLECAVVAGGQELAMHDSRNDPGFALHAVVEPAPGRHTTGAYLYYEMFQLWTRVKNAPKVKRMFYPKGEKYTADPEKARWAANCSKFTQVMNGCGVCMFGAFIGVNRLPVFEWLNAATGWNQTPDEFMQIGWNIQNLRQAFNAREGIPLQHAINKRAIGVPPMNEGVNKNRKVPIDELTHLYWQEMMWDMDTGQPDFDVIAKQMEQFRSLPM